ncbi:hypothetical protein Tdes44962_MAKER09404 [Teratosphaeria destructans]|uniref:Uncharacterized protein n=1 Tax=Teratosphaeria destructans TaxID=418781 RepID=A0A9W7STC9_9PEZI|nr:hypothetical protein Tdes44962_MAKER09404 [Teratosphaeria destructans]
MFLNAYPAHGHRAEVELLQRRERELEVLKEWVVGGSSSIGMAMLREQVSRIVGVNVPMPTKSATAITTTHQLDGFEMPRLLPPPPPQQHRGGVRTGLKGPPLAPNPRAPTPKARERVQSWITEQQGQGEDDVVWLGTHRNTPEVPKRSRRRPQSVAVRNEEELEEEDDDGSLFVRR